ncbi:hypothetical protein [Streptomyces sp. NBC_01565]|uniref:hypothetical protein n=1 Tax=unclassified Streptomyces TaxID=2593676 RepID=UPI00225B6229|nr:hypothetical protein [Streptomyces sp. NBC_01565]MCX4545822.1 hypothetical protein [Streptomyces sp. NBC_01565]
MSRGWKITVIVLAVVGIVSTPLVWLLGSPDGGQFVGASVQAGAGIAALVWAMFQQPARRTEDLASHTGEARAEDGGRAHTGVKHSGGRGRGRGSGSAKAIRTGNSTATGEGSSAGSGVEYD